MFRQSKHLFFDIKKSHYNPSNFNQWKEIYDKNILISNEMRNYIIEWEIKFTELLILEIADKKLYENPIFLEYLRKNQESKLKHIEKNLFQTSEIKNANEKSHFESKLKELEFKPIVILIQNSTLSNKKKIFKKISEILTSDLEDVDALDHIMVIMNHHGVSIKTECKNLIDLLKEINALIKYRNKLFHGGLWTGANYSTADIKLRTLLVKKICKSGDISVDQSYIKASINKHKLFFEKKQNDF